VVTQATRPSGTASLRGLAIASERQPGGREPAPKELALLQAFVNTEWNLDSVFEDRLATPRDAGDWLAARGLLRPEVRLDGADFERVRDLRRGLRELLFANNGAVADRSVLARLNAALEGATVSVRLFPSAPPDYTTVRDDLSGALGMLAAVAALAQLDGRWSRLKACRGPDCGWTFYDHSRNASGNWCTMSVCGARTKARAYRKRHKQP
jgi:predicted RNA-binding Zn ribbon-like protein